MGNIKVINIAGTECRPDVEEKWNQWYNEIHVPMLFKYPGVKRATRYKRIGGDEAFPQYIAVYEFEEKETLDKYFNSPERAAALEDVKNTWQEGEFTTKGIAQYEFIKSWER